jgi:hypothetical protein
MSEFKKQDKLWLPEVKKEDMPRFQLRYFTVYYSCDIEKFKELVEKENGYWQGSHEVDFLNYKNQRVGFQHVCIYQLDRELSMEVCC